jgi:hypothetical protein
LRVKEFVPHQTRYATVDQGRFSRDAPHEIVGIHVDNHVENLARAAAAAKEHLLTSGAVRGVVSHIAWSEASIYSGVLSQPDFPA